VTQRSRFLSLLFACVVCAFLPLSGDAESAPPRREPTLDDYRHFRIAAIDLLGRMPTRDEVNAFERPDFDSDKFVEEHLQGPGYTERLTRIYMDLLRLEPNLNFQTGPAQLFRREIVGPDGKPEYVYHRFGQRRARAETDGDFCLTREDQGLDKPSTVPPPKPQNATVPANAISIKPKPTSKKVLDQYTVLVKPWWLYRDYDAAQPQERYGGSWINADPEYRPIETILNGPDGKPVSEVRVCREEAQEADTGHIFVSGRKPLPPGTKLPPGVRIPRLDSAYAKSHANEPVACETRLALDNAIDCGCGKGLSRCMPGDNDQTPGAFYFPNHTPLGATEPIDNARQQAQRWFPHWWSREVVHYMEDVFSSDRDFREMLTGKHTFVNGPLAQFYKSVQRGSCCGPEATFGMISETEPLFDPKNVPREMRPHDTATWKLVPDRGPHAAGILTTPMFLEKYASARARGAVLYNAFLCKSFVADNSTQLTPSSEPNLMVRPGCKNCHATLEPLAAYFARVEPASFVFLPQAQFPTKNAGCRKDKSGMRLAGIGGCNALYDPAFTDLTGATLRSAYGSPDHADATPVGAAEEIVKSPEFARCAVDRVTSSFLGRPTNSDDEALLASLTTDFTKSGYRMRALVKSIMRSPAYRSSNNLSGDAWRNAPTSTPPVGNVHGGGMQ
jgi:hypothetical protein